MSSNTREACSSAPWRMLLALTIAIGVHATLFLIRNPTMNRMQTSLSLIGESSMELSLVPSYNQGSEMPPVEGDQKGILTTESLPLEQAVASSHISTSFPVLASACATKTSSHTSQSSVPSSRFSTVNSRDTHPQRAYGKNITKAGYLYAPQPLYPPFSRRSGHMGLVLLSVLVNQKGKVSGISVMKSSGYTELDQQALRTIRDRWKFKPAMKYGIPLATEVVVPIRFSLSNCL